MSEAVASNEKLRKRFDAVIRFEIGDSPPFLLDSRAITRESKHDPDLVIRGDAETFQDLLSKKTTPQKAFMQGKIKVKGKMALAMKLQHILAATRKHMQAQTSRL